MSSNVRTLVENRIYILLSGINIKPYLMTLLQLRRLHMALIYKKMIMS
jgi:hypothetical protein